MSDKEEPKKTVTKQWRITRTYLLTTEDDQDVEEFWTNIRLQDENDYLEEEKIELIAEI